MKKALVLIFLSFVSANCSSLRPNNSVKTDFTYQDINSLKIGSGEQGAALEMLGPPRVKVLLPFSKTEEAWLYSGGGIFTRILLIFDKQSHILLQKTWFLIEQDAERNLEVAQVRFPQALLEMDPTNKFVNSVSWETPSEHPRLALQLDKVERLRLGVSSRNEAIEKLGIPDRQVTMPDSEAEEFWLYMERPRKATTRLSLVFDKSSGILRGFTWWVREKDPEYQLAKAQSRYPMAKFSSTPVLGSNPHYISDEIRYSDRKLGLNISYMGATDRVESISWFDPSSRAPSSASLLKPQPNH